MIEYQMDVPMPEKAGTGGRAKYPLGEMPVGASFFAPVRPTSISTCFVRHTKEGKKFATRAVTENGVAGVRVWRVK